MSAEAAVVERADAPPLELQRGLALGFLAMTPLLLAYELAHAASGAAQRNAAEVVLWLPFAPFGRHAELVRALVLAGCAGWALWSVFHAHLGLFARLARIAAEGALGALLLGPLLVRCSTRWTCPSPPPSAPAEACPSWRRA